MRCRSMGKGSSDVFHQQHEVEWVCGAVFELGDEVPVEVAGVAGFGVDEECPTADLIGEDEESQEHVLGHAGAESSALMTDVHPEAGQEGDGLGVAPTSFTEPRGRVGGVKLGHAPKP